MVWGFLFVCGFCLFLRSQTSLRSPTSITPPAVFANSDFVLRVIFPPCMQRSNQDRPRTHAQHSQALQPKQRIGKCSKIRADTGKRPQTSRQQEGGSLRGVQQPHINITTSTLVALGNSRFKLGILLWQREGFFLCIRAICNAAILMLLY